MGETAQPFWKPFGEKGEVSTPYAPFTTMDEMDDEELQYYLTSGNLFMLTGKLTSDIIEPMDSQAGLKLLKFKHDDIAELVQPPLICYFEYDENDTSPYFIYKNNKVHLHSCEGERSKPGAENVPLLNIQNYVVSSPFTNSIKFILLHYGATSTAVFINFANASAPNEISLYIVDANETSSKVMQYKLTLPKALSFCYGCLHFEVDNKGNVILEKTSRLYTEETTILSTTMSLSEVTTSE